MPTVPKFRYITINLGQDGVLVLKYNRPEVGNAINYDMNKELLRALQWAVEDPRVRVIVQTGEGRFFNTGMDMTTSQGEDDSPRVLYEVNKLMIDCKKITIAAINGPGVGYGASSIALFDLVYAVPGAYFFTPFIKWGLRRSMLKISATDLATAGLVSKIIPEENFMSDVLAIASHLALQPTEALIANKRLLSKGWSEQLHKTNERELRAFDELIKSGAAQKRVEMFAAEQALKSGNKQGRAHNL